MFVADTDLISELRQKAPNPKVLQWMHDHDHELFLTAVTIGEIKKGVEPYPEGRKKHELSAWFGSLLQDFEGYILEYSRDEGLVWGTLYATAQKAGRKPPAFDSLNAAIALRHGLTLVTRNEKDYTATPVKVFNPWK
ncbi:MAG TPA: type II toxin-antitoxin system VapC family toxin [Verrucomicrobiae bacterium]|nr:type II toxin-antitoxin system VapC family toxin [Verrucomicrobiae bacterium]